MPQFDQLSFLNQVFFFLLIFINFYYFISYFFLPLLSTNLKSRKKRIKSFQFKKQKLKKNRKEFKLFKKQYLKSRYESFSDLLLKARTNINVLLFKKKVLSNTKINKQSINLIYTFLFYPAKFKNV